MKKKENPKTLRTRYLVFCFEKSDNTKNTKFQQQKHQNDILYVIIIYSCEFSFKKKGPN